jgi:hypothetical protein
VIGEQQTSATHDRGDRVGQDGWEEIADYALDWAIRHAATGTPA